MFWNKKESEGPAEWLTDEGAALREANRRIDWLLGRQGALIPKHGSFAADELFLSDLGGLSFLPARIVEAHEIRSLFLGEAAMDGKVYAGLTKLRDISLVANLKSLKYLSLSGTQVEDLSPLTKLKSLSAIDMENTPVSSIESFVDLPNLREIYLSGSKVRDVSPLARLAAANSDQGIKFSIKGILALDLDPRLNLLVRLASDQSNSDIIQYLSGNHPAFNDFGHQKSISDRLANASPVKFRIHEGLIEAVNQEHFTLGEIQDRSIKLAIVRQHLNDLLDEAKSRQIPEEILSRLNRYSQRIAQKDPLYVSLDGSMSFLRGALADPYITEATDGGFVAACKMLIKLHDSLRTNYVNDDIELVEAASILPANSSVSEMRATFESAKNLVSDPGLVADIGNSVVEAVDALRGYVEAAEADHKKPGLIIRGLVAISTTLAALSATASLHLWAVNEVGVKFLAGVKELISGILRALHLI